MDEYTNPAKRLLSITEKIQQSLDGMPMVEVWANVLGLSFDRLREEPYELYEKLSLIRQQIRLVEELMGNTHFSKHLYDQYLVNIKRIVSISNLESPWVNYKHHLSSDALLALRYCSEILPHEASIPVAEMESLLRSITEVRTEIENLSFSPGVKEHLLRHISIIEEGIRDYPISGSSSIAQVLHESVRMAASATPMEQPEDRAGYAKVMQVLGKFWSMSKEVVHADRFATLVGSKIEQGLPLIGKALELLP